MAPNMMKGPGKVHQGNLVVHPTDSSLYIGYVLPKQGNYRGYFFERPRPLHLALRTERNVLVSPQPSRPKISAVRFAMKVHFEAHMMEPAKGA